MLVQDIMSRSLVTARAKNTVREVLHMLREADIRHVPVVDDDGLVGIVSDRDLRAIVPWELEGTERPEEARKRLNLRIGEVMNTDVATVNPESELSEAIDVMLEGRVGAVPVVDVDGRKLLGILSYVDVLRAARDLV